MAQVMQETGDKAVEESVGVDATGDVFNSITAVEKFKGHEMNAFVNPAPSPMTSMVQGGKADAVWAKIIGIHSDFAGRKLEVNQEVYKSESDTNQRNQAIGMLMFAYGLIKANPRRRPTCTPGSARSTSTRRTSPSWRQRSPTAASTRSPRRRSSRSTHVPGILAVMATAGMYDDSGKWLFHAGLPAKSGVGGGIIAVSPGKFGIAAFSPPLDAAGNSVRAQKAITDVSNALGGNPYAPQPK
jgi:glutaminase